MQPRQFHERVGDVYRSLGFSVRYLGTEGMIFVEGRTPIGRQAALVNASGNTSAENLRTYREILGILNSTGFFGNVAPLTVLPDDVKAEWKVPEDRFTHSKNPYDSYMTRLKGLVDMAIKTQPRRTDDILCAAYL